MSKPSILINVANLRSGGGLQVGASFLDEIVRLRTDDDALASWPWLSTVDVEASDEVMANLARDPGDLSLRVGTLPPSRQVIRRGRARGYDVSFMLFGPDYGPRRARRRLVGFADVTSLFPEVAARPRGLRGRLRAEVRRNVSRRRFLEADRLVVESPHMVDELRSRWGIGAPVDVIPNAINSVFRDECAQEAVRLPEIRSPALFFPTRAHSHKNLPFLGSVGRELLERHDCRVTFVLTLTAAEWAALPGETREFSLNLGPLRVGQLPAVYRAADAAFFPSLLESQSATPLEALAMGCPLVASDRPFVRSVVKEAAWYFDPLDPVSAADAVRSPLLDPSERERRRRRGVDLMASWPTASDRAASYLDVIAMELAAVGSQRSG